MARRRQSRRRRTRRRQRGGGLQVEGLQFPETLRVEFQGGRTADGQLIARALTLREPLVAWPRPEAGTPPYRTFCVVDPDAQAKSWLHWLVVNCEGGDPETGTEIAPWEAPNPAAGTHRYFFCVLQHGAPIQPEDVRPDQRGYWNFKTFVETHGLVPVAAAMVQVRKD